MSDSTYRVYGYRWVVLGATMFINLTIQILWISFAPITQEAMQVYGVTETQIGLLAMMFMIAYVPLSIPVSWVIDTFGFRRSVSIGAVLMSVFGLLRGLAGTDYGLVLWSTVGLACAQPFLLNAWTKLPAQWFAVEERATAVGMTTLASLLGIAAGMVLTPELAKSMSLPTMQLAYGAAAAFSAILFVFLARENPPTPPCPPGQETRALMLDGLKNALKVPRFWLYLLVNFIGMAIFNGLTTWIEPIISPRGFSAGDAGALGALLLVGGILGAVVIPPFSDRQHKRRRYLILGISLSIPGLIGLTYATDFTLLLVSAFSLGFFLVSANPVGMQYAAEITYPTPEGTSNGLIQLFGQGSVVFVFIMEALKGPDGLFTNSLLFAAALLVLSAIVATWLKDPVRK